MKKIRPKRIQVTTTLDAEVFDRVKQIPEPLSKFLDRAIMNELTRSATATNRLAEAFQECIQAALHDALEEQKRFALSAAKENE